jgi:hypothetical protein
MTLELPKPIATYSDADAKDRKAVAACFAENAIVVDENTTYIGCDAIRGWKAASSAKYEYVSAPFAIAVEDDRTIVTSRLTGNFPGSPVDLRYSFLLDDDLIANLEIAP